MVSFGGGHLVQVRQKVWHLGALPLPLVGRLRRRVGVGLGKDAATFNARLLFDACAAGTTRAAHNRSFRARPLAGAWVRGLSSRRSRTLPAELRLVLAVDAGAAIDPDATKALPTARPLLLRVHDRHFVAPRQHERKYEGEEEVLHGFITGGYHGTGCNRSVNGSLLT